MEMATMFEISIMKEMDKFKEILSAEVKVEQTDEFLQSTSQMMVQPNAETEAVEQQNAGMQSVTATEMSEAKVVNQVVQQGFTPRLGVKLPDIDIQGKLFMQRR